LNNYAIIGDDVAIRNEKAATKYRDTMKLIGVDINYAKTVVSSDRLSSQVELAKRLFI
jgi:hypothetical protein